MKANYIIVPTIFIVLILIFMYLGFRKTKSPWKSSEEILKQVSINNNVVNVEIADTNAKRAKGLMFRQSLEEDKGMFFIFPNEAKHSFWMANTKIPLDIIWINKDLQIVHIENNVQPCTTIQSLCRTYTPSQNALYVLEVNAGWVMSKGIKLGDLVTLKL